MVLMELMVTCRLLCCFGDSTPILFLNQLQKRCGWRLHLLPLMCRFRDGSPTCGRICGRASAEFWT